MKNLLKNKKVLVGGAVVVGVAVLSYLHNKGLKVLAKQTPISQNGADGSLTLDTRTTVLQNALAQIQAQNNANTQAQATTQIMPKPNLTPIINATNIFGTPIPPKNPQNTGVANPIITPTSSTSTIYEAQMKLLKAQYDACKTDDCKLNILTQIKTLQLLMNQNQNNTPIPKPIIISTNSPLAIALPKPIVAGTTSPIVVATPIVTSPSGIAVTNFGTLAPVGISGWFSTIGTGLFGTIPQSTIANLTAQIQNVTPTKP
jgi:hypothetical protein